MISAPLRFHLPNEYRTFTPFSRLPPELRDQIWKSTCSDTGMHFVKLEGRGKSWTWISLNRSPSHSLTPSIAGNAEDNDEIAAEVKYEVAPKQMWDTQLVPIAPNRESDFSCYHNVHRRLSTLSLTCRESRAAARGLTSGQGILRLGNGSILSLADSSDVIFLEYFPPELYESGCGLAILPDCPDLSLIRRVAVRFCHRWQEKKTPSLCAICGQVHDASNRIAYPSHIYHFLARHLPNLEEFYFVDYLLVRKKKCSDEKMEQKQPDGPSAKRARIAKSPSLAIRCGNRTFYEANEDEWNIRPQVRRLMTWLQDKFVRYANLSRLSRHKTPAKVRFGLLACEWSIEPPVSLPLQAAPRVSTEQNWKARLRRDYLYHHRRQSHRQEPSGTREAMPAAVDSSVPLIFGNGAQDSFEFTFRVPPGRAWEGMAASIGLE